LWTPPVSSCSDVKRIFITPREVAIHDGIIIIFW
jgi:hypothetical protein